VGVLLLGASGIGKSECALELVSRGHRLVADDVVCVSRTHDARLLGHAPPLIRHFMEIRGIGLLYIPELFGPESVREESEIHLVCRLERWREDASYERVGHERPTEEILGLGRPALLLPVRPAGNMATLVEVAARDSQLRRTGPSAARRMDERFQGVARGERQCGEPGNPLPPAGRS
jgi:HPr kinase/phosphorylase